MSDNILTRVQRHIEGAESPPVTEIVQAEAFGLSEPAEIKSIEENYSVTSLKKNIAGTPATGFTMSIIADEFGLMLGSALHKAGVNSVSADVFGVFDTLGIIPKGFRVIEDKNINKKFFVLKDTNRSVDLYKQIITAINSTVSETVSFPYTVIKTVQLPIKYNASAEDYDFVPIKVNSLTLTKEEIESLNYTFITEIKFCKAREEDSDDLISLCIDREEWRNTPFRTSHVL